MRNKSGGVPPPHRYPTSCAHYCYWQFPVGLQQGSSCLVSYGDWVGFRSKGKHSLIKEWRGGSISSRVQTLLERQNTWLLLGVLAVGKGAGAKFSARHTLQISVPGTASLHTAPAGAILNWGVMCSPSAHAHGSEASVRPFGRNSVGSECWALQLCAGSSSDVLGTRLLYTALTGK